MWRAPQLLQSRWSVWLIDAGVTDEGIAARAVAHGHCPEARALDFLDEMAAMRCACSGDCVTPTSYCFMEPHR